MDWLGPVLGLFTGLGVLALGGLMGWAALSYMWHDLRQWRDALASARWSVTPGTVEEARVDAEGATVRTRMYYPRLRFRYAVDGVQRVSERWRFASTWTAGHYDREGARAKLKPYPPGATVEVYYDPQRPERATLERRWPALWAWPINSVIAFFAYGVLWVGFGVFGDSATELLRAVTGR